VKRQLMRFVKWAVVVCVFFFLSRYLVQNLRELRGVQFAVRPGLLAGSLGLLLAHFVVQSAVWHWITRRLGVHVRFPRAMAYWSYSALGKYVPGKVALVAGRLHFYHRDGKPIRLVAIAFWVDVACGMLSAAAVVIAVFLGYRSAPTLYPLGIAVGGAVALVLASHPRVIEWGLNLLMRILRRPTFTIGLRYRDILKIVLVDCADWWLLGFAFYLMIRSIAPEEALLFPVVVAAYLLASVAGFASLIAPAGLGVREGILVLCLQSTIPAALAVLVSYSARVWATVGDLLFVSVAWGFSRLASRWSREQASREDWAGVSSE